MTNQFKIISIQDQLSNIYIKLIEAPKNGKTDNLKLLLTNRF